MRTIKRVVVLLALIVGLLYLRRPPQAFAFTSACQAACDSTEFQCFNNCEKNAPEVGFCEEICTDNFKICSAKCG
jgi:hypothetical protein